MDTIKFTAKQARVIEIMRAINAPVFSDEIAERDAEVFEKGAKSVSPLMHRLCAAGYVTKEKVDRKVVDKEGKEVTKNLTQYTLTDLGCSVEYEVK